jgi:hypothetical protein
MLKFSYSREILYTIEKIIQNADSLNLNNNEEFMKCFEEYHVILKNKLIKMKSKIKKININVS